MVEVRERQGAITFQIRVQPRASRTEIVGEQQGAVRVRVAAPPVDGKANEECVRFFAGLLGIRRNDVEIISGLTARTKVVSVRNVALPDVVRALGSFVAGPKPAAQS